MESTAIDHSDAEGVGTDAEGNVYGALVRRQMLEKHCRRCSWESVGVGGVLTERSSVLVSLDEPNTAESPRGPRGQDTS
jgi:hypothetical protein